MTTTINTITIMNRPAVVSYIDELKMFRGKFLNTTGYCDFVADSVANLFKEGEISLAAYLEDCQALGIEPFETEKLKTFTLRYSETLAAQVAAKAQLNGVSVNSFIINLLAQNTQENAATSNQSR